VKARRAIDLVWLDPQRARSLLAVPTTPSSRGLWSALALVCDPAPHFPAECCRYSLVGSPALGLPKESAGRLTVPYLGSRIRADRSWGAVVALAAAMSVLAAVAPASAGILDFLFGGGMGGQPQRASAPAPQSGLPFPFFGPPNATINVNPSVSGGGQYVAYCVRLCDGRYFPLQRSIVEQSTQVCQSLCPAAKTKVLFGTEIAYATAVDGTPYARLPNAFAYREKIVPACTCNGRDSFGMATMKIEDDPTLEPGDLVSTKNGLVRYTGYSKQMFTPIEPPPKAGKRQASGQYSTRLPQ
jgi:Protein of unknown function (DUF2865)